MVSTLWMGKLTGIAVSLSTLTKLVTTKNTPSVTNTSFTAASQPGHVRLMPGFCHHCKVGSGPDATSQNYGPFAGGNYPSIYHLYIQGSTCHTVLRFMDTRQLSCDMYEGIKGIFAGLAPYHLYYTPQVLQGSTQQQCSRTGHYLFIQLHAGQPPWQCNTLKKAWIPAKWQRFPMSSTLLNSTLLRRWRAGHADAFRCGLLCTRRLLLHCCSRGVRFQAPIKQPCVAGIGFQG